MESNGVRQNITSRSISVRSSPSCKVHRLLLVLVLSSSILSLQACNIGLGNLGFGNVGFGNVGFGNLGVFNSGKRNVGAFNRASIRTIGVGNWLRTGKVGVLGIGVPNLLPVGKKK